MKPTERIDLARAARARRKEWVLGLVAVLVVLLCGALFAVPDAVAYFWYDYLTWTARVGLVCLVGIGVGIGLLFSNRSFN